MTRSLEIPGNDAVTPSQDVWTTRRLLKWMTGHFQSRSIESPRLVAEMLLAHVIGCDRLRLYMEIDRLATPKELAELRDVVARAGRHEPVQYLTGRAWFFGREYIVNRSTMIPRPCTETLVEQVLAWCRQRGDRHSLLIADIGTGTGCVAVSLAAKIPSAHVVATDCSIDALNLAATNAAARGVSDRIEFLHGSGLLPLQRRDPRQSFDVICSNPPYIPDEQWDEVAANVKNYEPESALRGGPDGLDIIRPLINEAGDALSPGGLLAVEIAHSQRDAVLGLVRLTQKFSSENVLKDYEGFWRVLIAERDR